MSQSAKYFLPTHITPKKKSKDIKNCATHFNFNFKDKTGNMFQEVFLKLEMCRCDTDAPAGIAKLEYGTC